jgi:hypothetical protein
MTSKDIDGAVDAFAAATLEDSPMHQHWPDNLDEVPLFEDSGEGEPVQKTWFTASGGCGPDNVRPPQETPRDEPTYIWRPLSPSVTPSSVRKIPGVLRYTNIQQHVRVEMALRVWQRIVRYTIRDETRSTASDELMDRIWPDLTQLSSTVDLSSIVFYVSCDDCERLEDLATVVMKTLEPRYIPDEDEIRLMRRRLKSVLLEDGESGETDYD